MKDKIEQKIKELTDSRSMFTAYDVTVSMRNDGERVKHNDVKVVVHEMFDKCEMEPGYLRKLTDIPNTNNQALLYHHVMSDTDEYEPVKATYKQNNDDKKQTKPNKRTTKGRNCQPTDGYLDHAFPKSNGKLNIPMSIIKEVGLFNKKFGITINNDHLAISSDIDCDKINHIDSPHKDGTIEIPKRFLQHLGKSSYKIKLEGNEIHVS